MTQLKSRELSPAAQLVRSVEAALETGNYDRARLLMQESAEQFPNEYKALQADIASRFNVIL